MFQHKTRLWFYTVDLLMFDLLDYDEVHAAVVNVDKIIPSKAMSFIIHPILLKGSLILSYPILSYPIPSIFRNKS